MAKQFVPYEKMSKRKRKKSTDFAVAKQFPRQESSLTDIKKKETKKNLTFYKNYAIIIIEKINAAIV